MSQEKKNLIPQAAAFAAVALVAVLATKWYYAPKSSSDTPVYSLAGGAVGQAAPGAATGAQPPVALPPRELGDHYFGQGAYPAAIEQYRKAIAIDPTDVDSYNDLGLSLHYTGKSKEAIEILRKGTSVGPKYQIIWLTLGFVTSATGDKKTAEAALTKAALINPNSAQGKEAQAMLMRLAAKSAPANAK